MYGYSVVNANLTFKALIYIVVIYKNTINKMQSINTELVLNIINIMVSLILMISNS